MLTEPAAPKPKRPSCAPRRLLIVVDDTCSASGLCVSLRQYAEPQSIEAFVISPGHGTAATQWYSDGDAVRAEAMQRLRNCLDCLRQDGIRVSGALGEPDAVHAIADALDRFAADEIVLVTTPRRPSQWLPQSVIDRARQAFVQPITHVFMPQTRSGGPHARPGDSR